MLKLKRNKKSRYFLGFLLLLIIEILIAKFAHDHFIRPYLGDYLVVILIYCFLMSVTGIPVWKGILTVFLFSFAVEFFQLINIVKVLQYQPPKIVMIILGSSFSFWDLLTYCCGLFLVVLIEYYFSSASINTVKQPQR